jgi:hypothetical protein
MIDATPSHGVMTCSKPPAFEHEGRTVRGPAVSEAVNVLDYRWSNAPVVEEGRQDKTSKAR